MHTPLQYSLSVGNFAAKLKSVSASRTAAIVGIIANFAMAAFHFGLIFVSLNSFTLAPVVFFAGFGTLRCILLHDDSQGKSDIQKAMKFFIASCVLYICIPLIVGFRLGTGNISAPPWQWAIYLYILFAAVKLTFSVVSFVMSGKHADACRYCLNLHGIVTAFYCVLMALMSWATYQNDGVLELGTKVSLWIWFGVLTVFCAICLKLYHARCVKPRNQTAKTPQTDGENDSEMR